MANVTITAANVTISNGASEDGTAGEAVDAGETVYKSATDSKFYLADCDATAVGSNATIDNVYGVALNSAAADQSLDIQKTGIINIGGTVVVGTVYVQSATAGKIAPWADLSTTDYVTLLGVGKTASTLDLGIKIMGVQIPA